MEKWVVMAKRADFTGIGEMFRIDPVVARIIRNRDIVGEEAIREFLYASVEHLHDPKQMKDMLCAVDILMEKIKTGEKIRIIGDYDIDGVQATFILLSALKRCNAVVDMVIPSRIADGYGINDRLILEAKEQGVDTLLTCDNGIAAHKEIEHAKALGLTVIITDHHEVPYEEVEDGTRTYLVPNADAIVNPKQQDCPYPFKGLCGAAVAFKLVQVLYEKQKLPKQEAFAFLESAAFATIGDVMDLTGENRIIVKEGMKYLQNTKNKGLYALMLQNKLEPEQIKAYHIGFILGPCLNASGRLDTAKRALELLVAKEEEQAAILAKDLTDLNASRKELTRQGVEAAILQVEKTLSEKPNEESEGKPSEESKGKPSEESEGEFRGLDKVLVLYLPDCHESLAGIIAGRIRERYHRPVFILTKGEEGVKGSGRSIEGYSMYEEMTKCKELFQKYGGHKMAAGLSMEESNVESFCRRLNELTTLREEDLIPKVKIDVPMPISYITKQLIQEMQILEPFGKANEKPAFADKNIELLSLSIIGKNNNVCKMQITDSKNTFMEALYFGDTDALKAYIEEKYKEINHRNLVDKSQIHIPMSFVYYPQINEYRGNTTLQIVVKYYC
ncbi:single-stranded-DNA-specific exonuclease RecJ [Lachnospiraceae bacterium ZAX-1]